MRIVLLNISLIMIAQSLIAQSTVNFEELGFSFKTPDGWTGQQVDQYYALGHQSIAGLMIVSQNQSESVNDLQTQAQQGITEEGVNLQATTQFQAVDDKTVKGYYEGYFDGALVKCYAISLLNLRGSGLNVMILTTQDQFGADQEKAAEQLASSVTFFEPKEGQLTKEWRAYLVGKQLKYMNTVSSTDYSGGYSGTSDITSIKLYADGSFYYYSNSHASFSAGDGMGGEAGFGYANANNENEGTFKIYSVGQTTILELSFYNEEVYEYTVATNQEGHTLLNGTRYFVVGMDE